MNASDSEIHVEGDADAQEETEVLAPEVEQGDSAHHGDGDGDSEEATDSLSVEQADSLRISAFEPFTSAQECKRDLQRHWRCDGGFAE